MQKQFQQMTGKKQMTGYILFAAEIRKSITIKNPSANFGEISRLVGIEWKCLTETERKTYEDRAHQMNLESAERALSGNGPDSPQTPQVGANPAHLFFGFYSFLFYFCIISNFLILYQLIIF